MYVCINVIDALLLLYVLNYILLVALLETTIEY